VSDVQFSPDGLLLASAGLDKKLQMYVVDKEEDLPVVMDNNNGTSGASGSARVLIICLQAATRVRSESGRQIQGRSRNRFVRSSAEI